MFRSFVLKKFDLNFNSLIKAGPDPQLTIIRQPRSRPLRPLVTKIFMLVVLLQDLLQVKALNSLGITQSRGAGSRVQGALAFLAQNLAKDPGSILRPFQRCGPVLLLVRTQNTSWGPFYSMQSVLLKNKKLFLL